MSTTAVAPLRLVSFGDLEGRIWGGLLDAGAGPALVLGGEAGKHTAAHGTVALTVEDPIWQVSGEGIDLSVAPEPVPAGGDATSELCTVTGSISAADTTITLDCPGTRTTDPGDPDLGSLRSVAGWFGPELALTLHALRPEHARGHEADRIQATLFEAEGPRPVDEPRLSTTLRENGLPARTSLELWVGEGDDLYPRRAAAEASGPAARVTAGGIELAGVPLRCHAVGLEGAGVYLVARFS